jgi:methyl coenzyme M reductase subunit C
VWKCDHAANVCFFAVFTPKFCTHPSLSPLPMTQTARHHVLLIFVGNLKNTVIACYSRDSILVDIEMCTLKKYLPLSPVDQKPNDTSHACCEMSVVDQPTFFVSERNDTDQLSGKKNF